jgi:hypothetical protein
MRMAALFRRKSSEEGLEQAFNSLNAQREACAAFILSQKHEGWTVLPAQQVRVRRNELWNASEAVRCFQRVAISARRNRVHSAERMSFHPLRMRFRSRSAKSTRRLPARFQRSLSGSDRLESAEQKRFMHINDILRSTNSRHGSLKRAPVHAFGFCNVLAGSATGAELSMQTKGTRQSTR